MRIEAICQKCMKLQLVFIKLCPECERLLCHRCFGDTVPGVCVECLRKLHAEKKIPPGIIPGG